MARLRHVLLVLAAFLLAAAIPAALAANTLMAVDLGGEYMKVSIVRQGARPPVSIATNEMSRRRSAAAVAFVPAAAAAAASSKKGAAAAAAAAVSSQRLLGDDAAAAATRRPEAAVTRLRDVLMLLSSNDNETASLFPASSPSWPLTLSVAEEARLPGGGIALSVGGASTATAASSKKGKTSSSPALPELHSPEELAGAVLRYAQRVATAAAAEALPSSSSKAAGKKQGKGDNGKAAPALAAVVDAVVTVPPSLPPSARAALIDGATAAGINVLSLVSTPAAVSLAYGIERRFEESGKGGSTGGGSSSGGSKNNGNDDSSSSSSSALGPQLLIIYDQGSTHTSAALVRFSAYREPAKRGQSALSAAAAAPVSQFEIVDVAWDDALGSDALDEALLRHFASEFKEQTGNDLLGASEGAEGASEGGASEGGASEGGGGGGDPSAAKLSKPQAARALARLRKAVRRTKEVLSANAEAPCSVEELLDGRDFRSVIDRRAFERRLAGDHFARSAAPLEALLARNPGLKISDLAAVELVGGGTRVPGLQRALSRALGGRQLDRHLDADEAAAHGAALFAANASTAFRLRRFGGGDAAPFAQLLSTTVVDAKGSPLSDESVAGAALLPFGKRLPVKRVVKLPGAVDGVNDALSGGGEIVSSSSSEKGGVGGVVGGVFGKKKPSGSSSTFAPTKKAPANQLLPSDADGWLLKVSYDRQSRGGVPKGVDGGGDLTVGTWKVSGLAKAAASLDAAAVAKKAKASSSSNSRLVSILGPAKVEVHFRSSADARMEPRRAELIAEFEEEFEVEVVVKEKKDKKKKKADGGGGDAAAAAAGSKNNSTDNSTSSSSSEAPSPAPATAATTTTTTTKTEKRTRKRTARAPLELTPSPGLAQPRASEQRIAAARAALSLYDAADAAAAAAAAAKNELEAFIISLRARLDAANDDSSSSSTSSSSLGDDGGDEEDDASLLRAVSTADERGALHSSLTEAEDWLYDEGDGEGVSAFEAKLEALRKLSEGMVGRARERRALPRALARAREVAARAAADARAWKGGGGGKGKKEEDSDANANARPWLQAKDLDALASSADALSRFVDKEGAAQLRAKDATKPPKLTSAAVEEKAAAVEAQRAALAAVKKPPPAPKKEKEKEKEAAAKKEEEAEGEKKKEEEEKKGDGADDASSSSSSSETSSDDRELKVESGDSGAPSDDGHDEL